MKAIMISIKSKWCAKIMNGEKTIEVRKNKGFYKAIQTLISMYGYAEFYGYCTKKRPWLVRLFKGLRFLLNLDKDAYSLSNETTVFNGKVIFKFHCYKVEEFIPFFHWCIEKETCLTRDEVLDYLDSKDKAVGNPKRQQGKVYGIHISGLEIFDEPRELNEFKRCTEKTCIYGKCHKYMHCLKSLTKAPQDFCYVEVNEDEKD